MRSRAEWVPVCVNACRWSEIRLNWGSFYSTEAVDLLFVFQAGSVLLPSSRGELSTGFFPMMEKTLPLVVEASVRANLQSTPRCGYWRSQWEGLWSDTQKTLRLLVFLSHSFEESFSPTRRTPNSKSLRSRGKSSCSWFVPITRYMARACSPTLSKNMWNQDRVAQYREKS